MPRLHKQGFRACQWGIFHIPPKRAKTRPRVEARHVSIPVLLPVHTSTAILPCLNLLSSSFLNIIIRVHRYFWFGVSCQWKRMSKHAARKAPPPTPRRDGFHLVRSLPSHFNADIFLSPVFFVLQKLQTYSG